jgi:hypothetical protein
MVICFTTDVPVVASASAIYQTVLSLVVDDDDRQISTRWIPTFLSWSKVSQRRLWPHLLSDDYILGREGRCVGRFGGPSHVVQEQTIQRMAGRVTRMTRVQHRAHFIECSFVGVFTGHIKQSPAEAGLASCYGSMLALLVGILSLVLDFVPADKSGYWNVPSITNNFCHAGREPPLAI